MQRYLATAREAAGPERDVEECLDPAAACGEAMMLALRTREGADLQLLGRQHNLDVPGRYARVTAELAADGLLVHRGNRIALTPRGLMLANAVCGRFLE
jgi:coproporphyrinogen III oxidase-like Fe-S oxidoreductase